MTWRTRFDRLRPIITMTIGAAVALSMPSMFNITSMKFS
jgi:hypothetical protein